MHKCANSIWLGTAWLFANSPSKITNSSQVRTPTIYLWWKWAWLLPIDMTSCWLKPQPHCQLNPSAKHSAADHCQLNPPAKYSDQSAITYWRDLTKLQIIVRRLKIRSNNSAVLMFWYRAWFTALLLPLWYLINSKFFCFPSWLIFLCFQVEHIYLPGPTDWDDGADRLTPGIWRKIQNTKWEQLFMISPQIRNTKQKIPDTKQEQLFMISLPQIPDAWVGKGISHESLPHAETQDRDGSPALSHWETNQNLVPEQVRLNFVFFNI